MNLGNMTGDPNHETRPTIFDFEAYPSHSAAPIDWSRIPMASPNAYIPLGQFNSNFNHQQQHELGNFSFCTTQTPHPAQFPFPVNVQTNHCAFGANSSLVRCKRKTNSPPLQPFKQHITEEKMAEHMSRLHISSETPSPKETESRRTQRLYMCEEMRKLQSDSILPHSLLSRIQRPCTALVLWTPPQRLLNVEDNESGNNNEESVPDNNKMENEAFVVESDIFNTMDLDNV